MYMHVCISVMLFSFFCVFGNFALYTWIYANVLTYTQCTDLISAPFDQMSANAYVYKHPQITCLENNRSTLMILVASESKLLSLVRSFMHLCPNAGF